MNTTFAGAVNRPPIVTVASPSVDVTVLRSTATTPAAASRMTPAPRYLRPHGAEMKVRIGHPQTIANDMKSSLARTERRSRRRYSMGGQSQRKQAPSPPPHAPRHHSRHVAVPSTWRRRTPRHVAESTWRSRQSRHVAARRICQLVWGAMGAASLSIRRGHTCLQRRNEHRFTKMGIVIALTSLARSAGTTCGRGASTHARRAIEIRCRSGGWRGARRGGAARGPSRNRRVSASPARSPIEPPSPSPLARGAACTYRPRTIEAATK